MSLHPQKMGQALDISIRSDNMLRARSLKLGIQIKLSSSKVSCKFRDRLVTGHLAGVPEPRFNRLASNRSSWYLHSFGLRPEAGIDCFWRRKMEVSHNTLD